MHTIETAYFAQFVAEVKSKIRQSQLEALRSVNQHLINLYLHIGKLIVERQEAHGWGKAVVEKLSHELQLEFPGEQGYSAQNLWYMRQFYLEYVRLENLQPLVGEISWSKNVVIISKCKDDLQREWAPARFIRWWG